MVYLVIEIAHIKLLIIPIHVNVSCVVVGAYGYFEVTHDITKYCKAKLFDSIGKKTPMFIRFSTVGKFAYFTKSKFLQS